MRKIIQTKRTTLVYGINDSATTMRLTNLLKLDGSSISASDIGDILYGTYDPGTSREEIFSIAGANVTVNADGSVDITGIVRGLKEIEPYGTGGFATDHPAGAIVVFGNNPQLYNSMTFKDNDEEIAGEWVFPAGGDANAPKSGTVYSEPIDDLEYISKKYADELVNQGSPKATETVYGITKLSTPAVSPTNPIAVGDNDTRMPTQDENNALLGSEGTPNNDNRYITEEDTAENTASKLVRRKSDSNITVPATPTASTDAVSRAYSDAGSNAIDTTNYVLGESFTGATTPQPAYVVDDLYQFGMSQNGNQICDFGRTSGNIETRALKIIPRANVSISKIRLQLGKSGNPADNVLIEIQTDTAGSPSGTVVTNGTSGTQAGSGLSATVVTEVNLTFATPPALVAGTTYWVVIKRSGSLDNSNYYNSAGLDYTIPYASFAGKSYKSSAWSTTTTDANMLFAQLYPSSGKSWSLWKTDSDSTTWLARQFFGFCTTTGSAGASATLVKSGTLPGFTNLNPGSDYTTSTTAGAISNSNGGIFVGTAISTTEILIPKTKYGDGTLSGSMLSATSVSAQTFGTSPARYKLPFNGNFILSFTAGGSGTTIDVYVDNVPGTYTMRYNDQAGSATDLMITVPYSRGQYINFFNANSGTHQLTFQPIIE